MNHSDTFLPTLQIVLLNQLFIVSISNIFQDVCDEIVCCFGEEGLESRVESVLVKTVGDNQGFGCSATFECCVNSAFVVSNQNVVLNQSLLADVPVEVSWDHVVFYALVLLIVRIVGS